MIAVVLPFLLITFGELEVPSGLTAVLISPAALFVALLAPFIDPSERIDRRQAVGLVGGLAGVALVVGVESIHSLWQFLGAMAMIGAAILYALSGFVVKGPYKGLSVGADVVHLALGRRRRHAADRRGDDAERGARACAPCSRCWCSALVGTALAFVIFYKLIAEVGAGRGVARQLPGAGRRPLLRRGLPRRGGHRRRGRRPRADPRRRRARLQDDVPRALEPVPSAVHGSEPLPAGARVP